MSKVIIRRIEKEDLYDLRHEVLRPHRPYNEIVYETDFEATTFHVGAYMDGALVAIASFNVEYHDPLNTEKQYRLRAMATKPVFRKQGLGRRIVEYAVDVLKEKGVEVLWCKGRTSVQGYYEQIGFKSFGEVFDYPTLGPHIILYRKLS